MTRAVPLADLLGVLPGCRVSRRVDGVVARDITADSRKVRRGSVFFCFKGSRHDGHDHVPQAVRDGSVAIVAGHPVRARVPVVLAGNMADALARTAAAFWGYPSRRLDVVGITGTNGKSTAAWMAEAIFGEAGVRTGLAGTILCRLGSHEYHQIHTTPMADDLQRMMADMVFRGARALVMEVSSHSLAQGRVTGTSFRTGVFTNLTQDHLDFHINMSRYFAAKALLFGMLPASAEGGVAVLNWDTPRGRELGRKTRARVLPFSAAKKGAAFGKGAGLWATGIRATAHGTEFTMNEGSRNIRIRLGMPGVHNVENALAAAGAARALGIGLEEIRRGLERLEVVPGRMERVPLHAPFTVLVDYAHTPDALERLLSAVRPLARRDMTVVFGCGGNRDRAKRPLMGRIASRKADFTWLTSDNPRDEEPDSIIREIAAGMGRRERYEVAPDRRVAIRRALASARPGDVVVVAGKGHERLQVARGQGKPFHDPAVVREEWKKLAGARA